MARQKSLQALERKIREMQAQVARLKQVDKPGIREVLALLRKHGLSLADVKAAMDAAATGAGRTAPKGRKVLPKYRNPTDGTQTWTGRGRMPLWMADLMKKGEKRESFLISAKASGVQNIRTNGQAEALRCVDPAGFAAADVHETSATALR